MSSCKAANAKEGMSIIEDRKFPATARRFNVDHYEIPEEGYTVGAWCPTPDGTGPVTQVHFILHASFGDIVIRLKSPDAADELISLLERYRKEVWGPR